MYDFKPRRAGWILLSVLILMLAACGGNNAVPESANPPASEPARGADTPPTTRSIAHLQGTSEIPAKIERIVVLSAAYIDHLLAIGEKPVGVNVETRYGGDYLPYLADQLEGVALVGSEDSPNLEAIVAL